MPSTDFAAVNEPLGRAATASTERLERAGSDVRRFMDGFGATRMQVLPHPLLVDAGDHDRLVAGARALIDAQSLLLRRLLSERSVPDLVDFFGLPPVLGEMVDPDELTASRRLTARLDVLPTPSGYRFCEFNVDTSISGFEFFECARLQCDRAGLDWMAGAESPLGQLAALVAGEFARGDFDRVVLCDWSSRIGVGYFGFEMLRDVIAKALPDVPVLVVYHGDYPQEWLSGPDAARTLVYRGFMYEDVDDHTFLRRLVTSGARIVNLFDTEVRSHKSWFAMLWDDRYRRHLTPEMVRAVDEFVPWTVAVTPDELDALLDDRGDWVFKFGFSSGGHDVLMGADHPAAALRERLERHGTAGWVAQERVTTTGVRCATAPRREPERLEVVLGLFLLGAAASGLNVRADAGSNVVNIHRSASSGWAIPMTGADRDRAVASLAVP